MSVGKRLFCIVFGTILALTFYGSANADSKCNAPGSPSETVRIGQKVKFNLNEESWFCIRNPYDRIEVQTFVLLGTSKKKASRYLHPSLLNYDFEIFDAHDKEWGGSKGYTSEYLFKKLPKGKLYLKIENRGIHANKSGWLYVREGGKYTRTNVFDN